jgi:hypothetical protein
MIGESRTANGHTWYLSVLRAIDSDEVSASITAVSHEPGQVDLTADVCVGATILIDDVALTADTSPAKMLAEFFHRAAPILRGAVDALMNQSTTIDDTDS